MGSEEEESFPRGGKPLQLFPAATYFQARRKNYDGLFLFWEVRLAKKIKNYY